MYRWRKMEAAAVAQRGGCGPHRAALYRGDKLAKIVSKKFT